jgi:histidinol-phosphate aminotransferase
VKPSLVGVAPYDPGESLSELKARYGLDEIVKLNWNEGLFGPVPGALEAAAAELESAWQYPESDYSDLREAVAAWIGVRPEEVVPGHGIQALVTTLAAVFVTPGTPVVVPRPTYGLYGQVLRAAGASVRQVPLAGYRLDLEAIAREAAETEARLAVVCDPNNPTGAHVDRNEWEAFLDALPDGCVAVVDEAYREYADPERRVVREGDVVEGRPVILLRTFSKIFGLAGLRLGYAVAPAELASFLDVVQEPFSVNRAALAAGRASVRPDVVEDRRREAVAARELLRGLLEDAGLSVAPSQTNFLLVELGIDDLVVCEALLRRGLLVRPGSEFGLAGTVRITVGPVPIMERVARELVDVLAALAG